MKRAVWGKETDRWHELFWLGDITRIKNRYFKRKTTSHPSCLIIQFTSKLPQSMATGLAIFMSLMSLCGLKVGRDRKEQGKITLVSLACVKDSDPHLPSLQGTV